MANAITIFRMAASIVLLFLLPLTIPILLLKYFAIVVCAAATFAAIQEVHLIRTACVRRRIQENGFRLTKMLRE